MEVSPNESPKIGTKSKFVVKREQYNKGGIMSNVGMMGLQRTHGLLFNNGPFRMLKRALAGT